MSQIVNLARNALRPGYAGEMLRKLWVRWRDRSRGDREESAAWCRQHEIDAVAWARSIDAGLWEQAEAFSRDQHERAVRVSEELDLRIGGAGFYELLYFLARLLRPATIVETGVAFGFSSRAFLRALEDNGGRPGTLYSSDFPYFRLANPERIIGCLVEPELRRRWRLMVGSDRENLKRIAADVRQIDLLHYDSDKSYSGRAFALRILGSRLAAGTPLLFDDIQDNRHFRDLVERRRGPHLVFAFGGKWIGLTGGPDWLYPTVGSGPSNRSR